MDQKQTQQNGESFFFAPAVVKNAKYFRLRAWDSLKEKYWTMVIIVLIAAVLGGVAVGSFSIGTSIEVTVPSTEAQVDALLPVIENALSMLLNWDFNALFAAYPSASVYFWLIVGSMLFSLACSLFVGSAVELGYKKSYLQLIDEKDPPKVSVLFTYFKKSYGKAILLRILYSLILFVISIPALICTAWCAFSALSALYYAIIKDTAQLTQAQSMLVISFLLMLVTGLLVWLLDTVVRLRYAFASQILAEYPEMGVLDAFRNSATLMKGYKWKLFCLRFSFIGWSILALICPFGVGPYLLAPYMHAAEVAFYHDIAKRGASEEAEFPSLDPDDYDPNVAQW